MRLAAELYKTTKSKMKGKIKISIKNNEIKEILVIDSFFHRKCLFVIHQSIDFANTLTVSHFKTGNLACTFPKSICTDGADILPLGIKALQDRLKALQDRLKAYNLQRKTHPDLLSVSDILKKLDKEGVVLNEVPL